MKALNREQKYLIISELASWYSPEELRLLFDIKYNEIYYYCNKYGIPKYREFQSQQKQEYLNGFEAWKEEQREDRLEDVKGQLGL